jgi:hypothetical protein
VARERFAYALRMLCAGAIRRLAAACTVAFACLALAACGGDDADDGTPPPGEQVGAAQPFPDPAARTLAELRAGLGPGPLMAKSVSVLQPGRNRFAFALFDRARRQIADTPAALYVAPEGGGQVEGPYVAEYRSLEVPEHRRSETVARDDDAAKSIYVADVPFRHEGEYEVLGVTQLDQRVVGGNPVRVRVARPGANPPAVGERVPRVHTPTREDGGDLGAIDTREPPSSMHDDDLAEVLGRRPVMLLFATPRLCRSRVCGPVVDILEEVKARFGDDAAFIHMEVWNGNARENGQRPQVRAFGLPSEPWLFAIDRSGRVAARIEGAFSVEDAEAALRKATGR